MTEIPNQSFRMPSADAKNYLEQASALMKIGHFQEAIPLYESALATLERTYGEDQPELAECLQELGDAYEAGYRLSDALAIHTRLLRLGEKILGKTNPNVVAMLFKLTQINEMLGRSADALAFCKQALQSAQQCLTQEDPLSQQIIDRYQFLTTLAQTQARIQEKSQNQAPAPDWQGERLPSIIDSGKTMQSANMQHFADEIPGDTPGSQRPFGQAVNADSAQDLFLANDNIPQVPSAQNSPAPNIVAPQELAAQNNNYQAILEAGFNAAQNHSLQTDLSYDPHAGISGTGASPPPAYEPGGEGYSMSDLDDIRGTGRHDTGDMYTPVKASRTRRISDEDHKRILIGRLAKDFALPAFGVVVLIGLLLFVIFGNKGSDQETDLTVHDVGKTATFGVYRTCDGGKEVRLVSHSLALLVTAGSAIEVPYALISGTFGDLFSAIANSVTEKQIWAEKKDFGLKTQDEVVYYASGGAESKVVAKMRQLAGYAQAYFFKNGEYPRYVEGSLSSEFSFISPLDSTAATIQIKTLLSQSTDGLEVKAGLESGLEPGLDTGPNADTQAVSVNTPCNITCYAVASGKPEDDFSQLRAVKFYIRGCDRNGTFLASGDPGRIYIVTAADDYLSGLPAVTKAAPKTKVRGRAKLMTKVPVQSSTIDKVADAGDNILQTKVRQPALRAVRTRKPDKNTRLWLIDRPAYPMLLIHHALPLALIALAVLAFLRSKMENVDANGQPSSSLNVNYALIAAAIFLGLAFLVLLAQFVIFA